MPFICWSMGRTPKVAAAGHGGLGRAEAAQHRADEVIGCAYPAHEVIGSVGVPDVGAVYFHRVAVHHAYLRAEVLKYRHEHVRVAYLRDVLKPAHAGDHKRGGNNGDGGVLRAADVYLAVERLAAIDNVFFQYIHLPKPWRMEPAPERGGNGAPAKLVCPQTRHTNKLF